MPLFNIYLIDSLYSLPPLLSYHGASAELAAGFLHLINCPDCVAEVVALTANGAVVERDFRGYSVRVERQV